MRRFKCTVAYVGRRYDGWQSQKLGLSVQEQIEQVLYFVAHEKINVIASGRTDAGVSARGQVFMFDTSRDLSARKWMGALNGYLPVDIHVMAVEEVDPHLFHARFCVRRKEYVYRINVGPYDVFSVDQAYQCPIPLDFAAMQDAAQVFVGKHDFASFNSNSFVEYPSQVRTLQSVTLTKEGNLISMSFVGHGFLRYMVRMMSAALIEVGKGKKTKADVQAMLDARSKTIPRKNAKPEGLTLESVDYFELVALADRGMVREFLEDDPLPEEWDLSCLEQLVKEKKVPRVYAVTNRKAQDLLGYFFVRKKGVLLALKDLSVYSFLREDIEKWVSIHCGREAVIDLTDFDSLLCQEVVGEIGNSCR